MAGYRLDEMPGLLDQWFVVAECTDVGRHPVAVRVLGRPYVLWRDADGRARGGPDRCPHREAPLSAGFVHEGCLVCPYHGWTFDGDGTCVSIPSIR